MAMNIEFKGVAKGFETVKAKIHNVFESIRKEKNAAKGIVKGLFGDVAGTNLLLGMQMVGRAIGRVIGWARDAAQSLINLADTFDQIAKSARRTGVSFETFQELTFVAKLTGATFENVERTFRTFQQRLLDLNLGKVEKLKILVKALGIDTKKLEKMDPFQAFMYTFGKIDKVSDPNLKRGIAQAFGGRGGTQTLPMIEQFKHVAAIFRDFKLEIPEATLKAGEDFRDQMLILSHQVRKLVSEFLVLEWSTQQLRKANISAMIARGEYGKESLSPFDTPVAKGVSAVGGIAQWFSPVGIAFKMLGRDLLDLDKNISEAATKHMPEMPFEKWKKYRELDLSSAEESKKAFRSASLSFDAMGGFSTVGMAAGASGDPVYTELKMQTEILKNIETHLLKTPNGETWTIVDRFEPGKMIHSGGGK